MSLTSRAWSRGTIRIVLAIALAALPAAARSDEMTFALSPVGGIDVQGGSLGDIYQPTGRLFGAELEFSAETAAGIFGFDFYSFSLRRPGHIIATTGDTLLEGETARMILYRVGGRRYLRDRDRWTPYFEAGFGLGAENGYFALSDTAGLAGTAN